MIVYRCNGCGRDICQDGVEPRLLAVVPDPLDENRTWHLCTEQCFKEYNPLLGRIREVARLAEESVDQAVSREIERTMRLLRGEEETGTSVFARPS